ncbi:hypothetical protein [Bradyrhizobium sp. CW7]|uniref:c-type cytochrome n=1 Tax=Bradyrhizobium sp. CW7 TaxID=2782688 RepID=UPI00320A627F
MRTILPKIPSSRCGGRGKIAKTREHTLERARRNGKDEDVLALEPQYRARPLDGVWATAPYLHNGSVPTLKDMLLPQGRRPNSFCVGSRKFDPVGVGLVAKVRANDACAAGLRTSTYRCLGIAIAGIPLRARKPI